MKKSKEKQNGKKKESEKTQRTFEEIKETYASNEKLLQEYFDLLRSLSIQEEFILSLDDEIGNLHAEILRINLRFPDIQAKLSMAVDLPESPIQTKVLRDMEKSFNRYMEKDSTLKKEVMPLFETLETLKEKKQEYLEEETLRLVQEQIRILQDNINSCVQESEKYRQKLHSLRKEHIKAINADPDNKPVGLDKVTSKVRFADGINTVKKLTDDEVSDLSTHVYSPYTHYAYYERNDPQDTPTLYNDTECTKPWTERPTISPPNKRTEPLKGILKNNNGTTYHNL